MVFFGCDLLAGTTGPNWVQWLTAVAAAIAAMLSGYGITVQRKISRQRSVEQISVFRREWINELRNTMAEFQSIATSAESDTHLQKDFYLAGTKIELLLNPKDEDYAELHKLLYRYLGTVHANDEIDDHNERVKNAYRHNAEFINVCQRILKREWERLKDDVRDEKV